MLGTLNHQEIEEVLHHNMLGRIGCRNGDDIYVVPVTYIYADNAVYCHSYPGQKIEWMRRNKQVCFEVEAIADNRNWKCVVAHGIFEELTDTDEIDRVKKQLGTLSLMRKASLTALPPSENPKQPRAINGPSVYYKIRFNRLSGREEHSLAPEYYL